MLVTLPATLAHAGEPGRRESETDEAQRNPETRSRHLLQPWIKREYGISSSRMLPGCSEGCSKEKLQKLQVRFRDRS